MFSRLELVFLFVSMAAKGSKKQTTIRCLSLKGCFGGSQRLDMEKSKSKSESGKGTDVPAQTKTQETAAFEPSQTPESHPIKPPESISPPPSKGAKSTAAAAEKGENEVGLKIVGELDPIVGALLMIVTLIVMLIWGQVCAIIVVAALVYFIPRFRPKSNSENVTKCENDSKKDADFDSPQYKKKVVLEGLLERNKQLYG